MGREANMILFKVLIKILQIPASFKEKTLRTLARRAPRELLESRARVGAK